jgi:hypothetical protein
MRIRLPLLLLLLAHASALFGQVQTPPLPAPRPLEPVTALIDAFRTHDIVTLSDPHGSEQVQSLLLSLVRDPRFPAVAHDIVLETASSRYQDVLDRFVRGEEIPESSIRRVWEEHTVPNSLGVQASELVHAVRLANGPLPASRKLRVLAGDPPIDWENVTTGQDHRRWTELRDSYPADLIRRQVLDRGRRALVVYGQGHLQRAMIDANYDTTPWQAQTVISLITREPQVRVFNVFTLLRDGEFLPEIVAASPTPSLAYVRGTGLGARDFGEYQQLLGGQRVALRDGQLVPLPREQWSVMALERQFDALLYLGPPSSFTTARVPSSLCQDSAFMARRLERLARFAPPIEVQRLKEACGAQ